MVNVTVAAGDRQTVTRICGFSCSEDHRRHLHRRSSSPPFSTSRNSVRSRTSNSRVQGFPGSTSSAN